jgi:hypothetical protein
MSHFSVAVFTQEGGKDVAALLAPYQENNMDDCPKEFLEFNDQTDEYVEEYKDDGDDMIRTPNGNLVYPWDERFRKPGTFGHGSDTHQVPEGRGYERVYVRHKDRFPTFQDFMLNYHGTGKDAETGRYGYWENPNAKWDWWKVGGRYSNRLRTKDGRIVNSAKVKDIDWDAMRKDRIAGAENAWTEAEGKTDAERYFCYGIEKDETREQYIEDAGEFTTFAVITPDGKWHEEGEMGWFACVSNEDPNWQKNYYDAFLRDADPEATITIVDCHI